VVTDLPPGHPGSGERFGYQILGEVAVTDADEHDPQAVILGGRVELAELSSLLLHAQVRNPPPIPLPLARRDYVRVR
jgi:hypothetical protein